MEFQCRLHPQTVAFKYPILLLITRELLDVFVVAFLTYSLFFRIWGSNQMSSANISEAWKHRPHLIEFLSGESYLSIDCATGAIDNLYSLIFRASQFQNFYLNFLFVKCLVLLPFNATSAEEWTQKFNWSALNEQFSQNCWKVAFFC